MGDATRLRGAWKAALEWLGPRVARGLGIGLGLALAFVAGRWTARSAAAAAPTPAVQQAQVLSASLRELEAELTATGAMVRQQEELQRRHERVSAIACTNAVSHRAEMDRIADAHRRRGKRVPPPDSDDHAGDEGIDERASAEEPGDRGLNGRRVAAARGPERAEAAP